MKIVVSNNYEGPIYEQIKRQIVQAILNGELVSGETLPSLRFLAKELKVGVLTVNRAYTELESEGYLETIQGKGCFVAERSSEIIRKHLLDEAAGYMEQAIRTARKEGASDEEILILFQEQLRRDHNE